MSSQQDSKNMSRGYITWTDEMDKVLLDTLVQYYKKGDRCQNGWKPHVYTAAVKNVREKCGVIITKDNISSRSKTFDEHYAIISAMLSSSGFGKDWEKNKLSIDSDSVWEQYIKSHKDAKSYRYKVIKYWESISLVCSLVCSNDHANGEAARTASESSREMLKEDDPKDPAGSTSSSSKSLKRQRSDDSFNSVMFQKMDMFAEALKDDTPKLQSSAKVLEAL